MLNVKEATEQIKAAGITASHQIVIRWILEGKLKAKRTKQLNLDYAILPGDLVQFILDKKIEENSKRYGVDFQDWENTFYENKKLKAEMEELQSRIRIEQSKVRSLKKMLRAEYALTETPPLTFQSLLGLDDTASKGQIKKEYKKLLKALHPDRGGDERLFKVFYDHYQKQQNNE